MGKFLSRLGSPAALLYLFLVVTQTANGFYLAGEAEPPPAFTLLYALGLLWAVGWWLRRDSMKRGVGWVFDMGLFLYVAWPFVMPYYLLKSRGVKGLLPILAFIGAYVGALVAGAVLYALLMP
jgi:hypothetical protein